MKLKFGDRVMNPLAAENNPHKRGIFVEMVVIPRGRVNSGTFYRLTDGAGDFWRIPDHVEIVMEEPDGDA